MARFVEIPRQQLNSGRLLPRFSADGMSKLAKIVYWTTYWLLRIAREVHNRVDVEFSQRVRKMPTPDQQ